MTIRRNKKIVEAFARLNVNSKRKLLKHLKVASKDEISLKMLHKLILSEKVSLDVRSIACSLAGEIRNNHSTGVLLKVFDDDDLNVSQMTLLSLWKNNRVREFMIKTLCSAPFEWKRTNAAYILSQFYDDEGAIDALVDVLNDKNQPPETRAQAAESLGCIGDTRLTSILVENLKDSSLEVRYWCIYALHQVSMDGSIIPELKRFLGDKSKVGLLTVEEEACEAIKTIRARVMALENYKGDKATADIWDIHHESLALREHIDCD